MKSPAVPFFTLLILGYSTFATAQFVEVKGTCSVEISGAHNFTIKGQAPAVNGGKKSQSINVLWLRNYFDEQRAEKPQAAAMYDNMQAASEASGVFALTCANDEAYLTISGIGYDIDPDDFAGKTGTYPLVGTNARREQPPGFTTGIVASRNGAMLAISPDEKPGELTLSKFTNTEISGTFEFAAKGNKISGQFTFERVQD